MTANQRCKRMREVARKNDLVDAAIRNGQTVVIDYRTHIGRVDMTCPPETRTAPILLNPARQQTTPEEQS